MSAQPKHPVVEREPGDDSVWDGRTIASFDDASLSAGDDVERPLATESNKSVADVLLVDSTCRPEQSQSPIEEMMFGALIACGFRAEKTPSKGVTSLATIYQQHPIMTRLGELHVDYAAVREVGKRTVKAVLELDGHSYHHASKEQVRSDYERVRALAREGWIVVRFTGSEVWRDADGCALEFAGIIIEAISRITEGR